MKTRVLIGSSLVALWLCLPAAGDPPVNCDFATGDLTSWVAVGPVSVETDTDYSVAALQEDELAHEGTNLHQEFTISEGLIGLSVTFAMFTEDMRADQVFIPDAFVVSLLDPTTGDPLLSTPGTTEFFAVELDTLTDDFIPPADPRIKEGPFVVYTDLSIVELDDLQELSSDGVYGIGGTVTLDLTSLPPGTPARLDFSIPGGNDGLYTQVIIESACAFECRTFADCDDDLFCNGEEYCEGGKCLRGEEPCTDPCHYACDDEQDLCKWCILDLNRSSLVDGPDFGFFSGCFGQCYLPEDNCAVANFDKDPNVCVGSGDFGGFAGCYAYGCAECDNCAGPGGGGKRIDEAMLTGTAVRLVPVSTPTSSDFRETLPAAQKAFKVKEPFYVEIWATRSNARSAATDGFAAVYTNVYHNPRLLEAEEFIPSDAFANLAFTTVDHDSGVVLAAGGCASFGDETLGVSPPWVRVGTVRMLALAPGVSSLKPGPAARPYGISVVNRFGDLDASRVDYKATTVTIRGLRDRRSIDDQRLDGHR